MIRKRRKAQEKRVKKLQQKFDHTDEQYNRSVKQLRNKKGRQRNRLIRENLERYKNKQPVVDSERQLSGKVVDKEVLVALERIGYITPQHMILIDTVLTMPGTTIEKEYERRIAAINAVIAVCDTEEGTPSRSRVARKRSADAGDMLPTPSLRKRQNLTPIGESDDAFSKAIASVCVKSLEERPTIYFICLGTPRLPQSERLRIYKNSGSLSRHFVSKYVKPFSNDIRCECSICGEKLESKSMLLNHTERVHGTVSRSSKTALGLT